MNRWYPPTHISQKEIVGRRTFGSRVFDKTNGVLKYKIDIFLDKRTAFNLSVDRLGVRVADRNVVDFLKPLCDESAEKRSSKFNGWAQISVNQIQKIGVRATEAINEENPYHAEISRSRHQTVSALRSLAFELCVYASKHDFISRPE